MSFGLIANTFPRNPSNGSIQSNQLFYNPTNTTQNYPATAPAGQTSLQAAYNGNWIPQQWYNAGVQLYKDYIDIYGVILFFYTNQDAAAEAAILDGAKEGIIWCAAAGNQYNEAGMVNNSDRYNNYLNLIFATIGTFALYTPKYHNRLPAPAHANRGIFGAANYESIAVVGNIGSLPVEQLDDTSSAGSAVNVFAPGSNIMSSYNAAGVADPRNPAYFLAKLGGTSMASPQVSGYFATVAENYPNLTQNQALQYLAAYQQTGAITDNSIPLPPGPVSYRGLREAGNNYLRYVPTRPITGNAWPPQKMWLRPTSGSTYPRTNQQYRPVQ
jgi:subtilisin family serine protease